MLKIGVKYGQRFTIGEDIEVRIVRSVDKEGKQRGGQVSVHIIAPKELKIRRPDSVKFKLGELNKSNKEK